MKRYILAMLVGIFALLGTISVGAQSAQEHPSHVHGSIEEIQKKRADYMIKELSLTASEADTFIPLVNEYMAAKFRSYRKYKEESKAFRNKNPKTAAEYEKATDRYLNSEAEKVALEKAFYQKIRKILSPEKVYKYKNAEHQYMHKMLNGRKARKAN